MKLRSDFAFFSSLVKSGSLSAVAVEFNVTPSAVSKWLAQLEARLEARLDRKFEARLELWGGALLARITASEQRLLAELARHTQAVHEAMAAQISVIDEKYNDLPPRVSRLEAKVFARKRR